MAAKVKASVSRKTAGGKARVSSPQVKVKVPKGGKVIIDPVLPVVSRSATSPDAPPEDLVAHARALVPLVRTYAARLAKAHLPTTIAATLDRQAQELEDRQTAWLQAHSQASAKEVQAARTAAIQSRKDLSAGLRFFGAGKPAILRSLEQLSDVRGDSNLVQTLAVLISLAGKHADLFQGTDLTPEVVATARRNKETLSSIMRASGGEIDNGATADDDAADLDDAARQALSERNAAFWALSETDRQAASAGRYIFRNEPDLAARFAAYSAKRGGTGKRKTDEEPDEPADGESRPAGKTG